MKTYKVEVLYSFDLSADTTESAEEKLREIISFRAEHDSRWKRPQHIKAVAEVVTTREEIPL